MGPNDVEPLMLQGPIAHCPQRVGIFFSGVVIIILKDVALSIGFARAFSTNVKEYKCLRVVSVFLVLLVVFMVI